MDRSPRRLPPLQVGRDTWLLRLLHDDEVVNAAVLLGPEPVLVGTGRRAGRRPWWDAVWSLVDPADVRWVLLGDDGDDQAGNLADVVAGCPEATVVASPPAAGRLVGDGRVPAERCLEVQPGDVVPVAGRPLVVVAASAGASPASVGYLDPSTGVVWSG